jgi:hypothetical protein
VLLTRSRLCPRPKPGSSLHLHVLGTPPAFVLSQDQTLREERGARGVSRTGIADATPGARRQRWPPHPHKESSGSTPARSRPRTEPRSASETNPGPVPGGIRPLRPAPPASADGPPAQSRTGGSPKYTEGSRRKTGSILAPSRQRPRKGSRSMRRRRTWTHLSTGVGRGVCMLLSFQRPSHLFRKGIFLMGAPGSFSAPGRTDEYSAPKGRRRVGDRFHPDRPRRRAVKIAPGP